MSARIDSISSAGNAKFIIWRSLLNSKGIKKENLFLLSGEKLVKEFIKNPNLKISCELMTKNMFPLQTEKTVFELDKTLFQELDVIGTRFNILVLELPEITESNPLDPVQGLEVVAPLGDPKNLGALIRSAVAFDIQKIHLTEESAHPYHPQCLKASAGAVLKAPLFKASALKNWDRQDSWALDSTGTPIDQLEKPMAARIIVGEEGKGLAGFENTQFVSIPTQNVESLNATVAASLIFYCWRRQTSTNGVPVGSSLTSCK